MYKKDECFGMFHEYNLQVVMRNMDNIFAMNLDELKLNENMKQEKETNFGNILKGNHNLYE